jgi:eukaryotic-like serine/threonine-protein kinase
MRPREKYHVLQKLDSGGMAEVFLAEAESIEGFKKQVAIKRVLPDLVSQEKALAMFLDEARLSLRFNHANVVHTFDVGRSGDTYFIVMEYVEGTNLKRVVETMKSRGERFSVSLTLYIIIEICRGLAYAHEFRDSSGRLLNVVHRDVSPPNILLSKQGEVKIVDFGLAKAADQLEITDAGMVKGKFAYLSPEVAYGNPADLRSDIFACGIILFELLTGERLFLGATDLETVELVRNAKIPSITERNLHVTPDLEQVVLKALSRSPADRYRSCTDLAEDLTDYLFKNGLKVTHVDLQRLVETVMKEDVEQPQAGKKLSVIDRLIHDELARFASLENGANQAVSRRQIGGAAPLDPSGFRDALAAGDQGTWQRGLHEGSHVYVPSVAPPPSPSLAQMLEGDTRAGDPDFAMEVPPPSRRNSVLIAVIAALFGLGLGGLLLFYLGVIP